MKQGFSAIAEQIRKQEIEKRVYGRKCSVGEFIKSLNKTEQKEFFDLVNNPKITQVSIIDALENNGIHINTNQFSKHFLGRCRCRYEQKDN